MDPVRKQILPLKILPILVPNENPFEHDAFDRRKLAEPLTQLLRTVDHPFVFAITGPWGCGKTTFMNQWAADLAKREWSVIKFNAWENDFSDSALATMIAELRRGVDLIAAQQSGSITKAIKQVKSTGKAVVRRLVPAAVKAVTIGALDINKEMKSIVAELAESIAGDLVEKHEQSKTAIREFKVALEGLVKQLNGCDPPRRLVIFVDELDRCRPSFALEMLEVMKHLFDINGIIFVLAIDDEQLRSTVSAIYGQNVDTREYLRKFIDMPFALPAPTPEQLVTSLWRQAGMDELLKCRKVSNDAHGDLRDVKSILQRYAGMFPRSVRFHEHIVTRVSAVLRTIPANYLIFADTLVFLLYLRELHRSSYEMFVSFRLSPKDALATLFDGVEGASEFLHSHPGRYLEASLVCAATADQHEPIKEYRLELQRAADEQQKARLSSIVEMADSLGFRNQGWLKYLRPKIELSDQFVDPTERAS